MDGAMSQGDPCPPPPPHAGGIITMCNVTMTAAQGKLTAALARARGKIEAAKKSEANPFYRSHYADLAALDLVSRGPLYEEGISLSMMPISEGLSCMLAHADEWRAWISPVPVHLLVSDKEKEKGSPPRTTPTPQEWAAALTYARRGVINAAFNLVADDDDGETAEGRGEHAPAPRKPAPKDIPIRHPAPAPGAPVYGKAPVPATAFDGPPLIAAAPIAPGAAQTAPPAPIAPTTPPPGPGTGMPAAAWPVPGPQGPEIPFGDPAPDFSRPPSAQPEANATAERALAAGGLGPRPTLGGGNAERSTPIDSTRTPTPIPHEAAAPVDLGQRFRAAATAAGLDDEAQLAAWTQTGGAPNLVARKIKLFEATAKSKPGPKPTPAEAGVDPGEVQTLHGYIRNAAPKKTKQGHESRHWFGGLLKPHKEESGVPEAAINSQWGSCAWDCSLPEDEDSPNDLPALKGAEVLLSGPGWKEWKAGSWEFKANCIEIIAVSDRQ